MEQAQVQTIIKTYKRPFAAPAKPVVFLTILQRLNRRDSEAVADCIDTYGGKIWAFANLHMNSAAKAERLTETIFRQIWIYAEKYGDSVIGGEKNVIRNIAYKCLLRHVAESARII